MLSKMRTYHWTAPICQRLRQRSQQQDDDMHDQYHRHRHTCYHLQYPPHKGPVALFVPQTLSAVDQRCYFRRLGLDRRPVLSLSLFEPKTPNEPLPTANPSPCLAYRVLRAKHDLQTS
jgi:hypothetical protein